MPEYGTATSPRAGVRSPGNVPGKISGRYENWVGEPSQEERTKDRLSQYGPKHLTNTELVAILPGIPQIKPPFLDIAPAGIPPNIIPHSKGVKCGLMRPDSLKVPAFIGQPLYCQA